MKHSFNILMSLCVAALVTLGIVALNKDGFILFRFNGGEMMIDGR